MQRYKESFLIVNRTSVCIEVRPPINQGQEQPNEGRDKIGVLLVDDHQVIREGYRLLLENDSDFVVVGEAESSERACQLYGKVTPDVVALDLNMPGMGGLETIRRLLIKDPKARILISACKIIRSCFKGSLRQVLAVI